METLANDKYKKIRTLEQERNRYFKIIMLVRFQILAQELQRAVANEQEMREILVKEIEDMKSELEDMRNNK